MISIVAFTGTPISTSFALSSSKVFPPTRNDKGLEPDFIATAAFNCATVALACMIGSNSTSSDATRVTSPATAKTPDDDDDDDDFDLLLFLLLVLVLVMGATAAGIGDMGIIAAVVPNEGDVDNDDEPTAAAEAKRDKDGKLPFDAD